MTTTPTITIDLDDPNHARQFCQDFRLMGKGKLTFVQVKSESGEERKIDFDTMTDDDAVMVANLLYDMQLECERRVAERDGLIQ